MLQLMGIHMKVNPEINPFSLLTWVIHMMLLIVLGIFNMHTLESALRYNLTARKIFKTAAKTVFGSANGFTERPFSAGKAEYTQDELIGFAQFLESKLMVLPVFTEKSIYLTFSMGRSPLVSNSPEEISYVAFTEDGKISVHVSDEDYRKYTRKLTFDQLCQSLSDNFKRYLNYYINNQESRIITELIK